MSIGVVVPAAGQGRRMKSEVNKQFMILNGLPTLVHTLSLFAKNKLVDEIVVPVKNDELNYCKSNITDKYFKGKIKLVAGGETRRQSVYAGLKVFSSAIDFVIVHDGARPLLTENLLNKIIRTVKEYPAVTAGTALKDTVKKIANNKMVVETLNRKELVSIQTPQAFSYELLMKAHSEVSCNQAITDDAALVEKIGFDVKVIEGSYQNIKITTPMDMVIAEEILKRRENGIYKI